MGASPAEAAAKTGIPDFSGLVDIGGRSLYLQCSGDGGPTVILESGLDGRGDVWSRDGLRPPGERTMVQPGVARFTHVCAYDRPGTIGAVKTLTVRRRRAPSVGTRCLALGATRPSAC